jgi:hypothetical protein
VEQWKVAGVVEEMVAGPVRRRWVGGSRQIIMPTQYYNCLHVTSVERESHQHILQGWWPCTARSPGCGS